MGEFKPGGIQEAVGYAPKGLMTNEYPDTAYSEDKGSWDWDEEDEWTDESGNVTDRYKTDMMDTYGTHDLDRIGKQNIRADKYAGGDVNRWQQIRSGIGEGMSGAGTSLMDFARKEMQNPYEYQELKQDSLAKIR